MRISRTTGERQETSLSAQGLAQDSCAHSGADSRADSCVHLRLVSKPTDRRIVESVAELAESVASGLEFVLVRVLLTGGHKPRLQVIAERQDGSFTVDDCATLSRALSARLDAQDEAHSETHSKVHSKAHSKVHSEAHSSAGDSATTSKPTSTDSFLHPFLHAFLHPFLQSAYVLEVSSPGVERPLTRVQDFSTFAGSLVNLRLNSTASQKRKNYHGTLIGLQEDNLLLELPEDEDTLTIPLAQVAEVSLHFVPPAKAQKTKTQKGTKKGRSKKSTPLSNLSSKPVPSLHNNTSHNNTSHNNNDAKANRVAL